MLERVPWIVLGRSGVSGDTNTMSNEFSILFNGCSVVWMARYIVTIHPQRNQTTDLATNRLFTND